MSSGLPPSMSLVAIFPLIMVEVNSALVTHFSFNDLSDESGMVSLSPNLRSE